MSDAVMVPSSWVKILRLIAEGHPVEAHEDQFIVVQNPDFQPDMNDPNFVIDTHALAASPSVGVWGEPVVCAVCDGFVPTWGVKVCDCEYMAPCGTKPAPPSVSTGSRPQEAVPTEQAEPAVVDDRLHDAIRQLRQHMTTIQSAKVASAAGQPQGMGPIWNLVNALPAIVRQLDAAELDIEAAFERYEDAATPQPAEGCSSNEGADE